MTTDGFTEEELAEMARQTKATKKAAEAQAVAPLALPLEVPLAGVPPATRVHVCLVGAGGTGGRVALLLPRLLRAGDVVSIVDPDVVEAKNLSRQHFHPEDVGRAKADIAAERLAAVAPEGLTVIPFVGPFSASHRPIHDQMTQQLTMPLNIPGTTTPYGDRIGRTIYIGAVDNRAARADIARSVFTGGGASSRAWIDAGNDFRTGQVCLNLAGWKLKASGADGQGAYVADALGRRLRCDGGVTLKGSQLCFPDTLDPSKDAADANLTCVGFDTQSVGVNALAATYACNILMWLLEGETIGVMSVFFSTLGGTSTFPIMSAKADTDYPIVHLGR